MKVIKIPGCQLSVINPKLIEEGSRFREDYGDLTPLKVSIEKQGLINPITVVTSDAEGFTYKLVAGGRRLRACLELGLEEIPIRIFPGEVSELDLRVIELSENLQRQDMTWSEQNKLQREIHRLQQQRYGTAVDNRTPDGGGWRLEDTAKMIGVSSAKVSDAISMTDKFERYKDILGPATNYKTAADAKKAIKVLEEAAGRIELAKRFEKKTKSNNLINTIVDSYQIGDCVKALEACADETFDFAEIDPPYAIELAEQKKHNDCEGYVELALEDAFTLYKNVLRLTYAKLKPNTFCICWFGIDPWFSFIYEEATKAGFVGSKIPMIWTKPNGQSNSPNVVLANCYETAFVFRKGSPILGKPGRSNVFEFAPVSAVKKHHPTEKPLELYTEIYNTFSFEGSKCVVPFAGSGKSLLAAFLNKRFAVGWDLTEQFKGGFIQDVQESFVGA